MGDINSLAVFRFRNYVALFILYGILSFSALQAWALEEKLIYCEISNAHQIYLNDHIMATARVNSQDIPMSPFAKFAEIFIGDSFFDRDITIVFHVQLYKKKDFINDKIGEWQFDHIIRHQRYGGFSFYRKEDNKWYQCATAKEAIDGCFILNNAKLSYIPAGKGSYFISVKVTRSTIFGGDAIDTDWFESDPKQILVLNATAPNIENKIITKKELRYNLEPGDSLGFDKVTINSAKRRTLRIRNDGNDTILIKYLGMNAGKNADFFEIDPIPEPITIQPNKYISISVVFLPKKEGDFYGVMNFTCSVSQDNFKEENIKVFGTGIIPEGKKVINKEKEISVPTKKDLKSFPKLDSSNPINYDANIDEAVSPIKFPGSSFDNIINIGIHKNDITDWDENNKAIETSKTQGYLITLTSTSYSSEVINWYKDKISALNLIEYWPEKLYYGTMPGMPSRPEFSFYRFAFRNSFFIKDFFISQMWIQPAKVKETWGSEIELKIWRKLEITWRK